MRNWVKYIILTVLVAILLAGIIACIHFIGSSPQTPKEAALFSIVLTIFSVLAGWLITHIYSEVQHQAAIEQVETYYKKNLRTYAIKASEKVENLSTEFVRLAGFLEDEDENKTNQETDDALLSKKERIKSAIHIINTLKSMNDTSLSDWEGVIDDILDKKRQEQEEQVETFRELVEKVEPILEVDMSGEAVSHGSPDAQHLGASIEALRKDIRTAINQMGSASSLRLPRLRSNSEDIISRCPACNELLPYRRSKLSSKILGVKCKSCEKQLISRYDDIKNEYILEVRKPAPETVHCPACQAQTTTELDLLSSPRIELKCPKCSLVYFVRRKGGKIRISIKPIEQTTVELSEDLSPEIIENVKAQMPPQPWPKWAHKTVASNLGLPEKTVSSAIQHLIKTGVFHPQIDGKVYVPRDETVK
jgi:ribosomal protein S27E